MTNDEELKNSGFTDEELTRLRERVKTLNLEEDKWKRDLLKTLKSIAQSLKKMEGRI